jgi:hypothetical protein
MKHRLTVYSLGIAVTAITATHAQSPSPSATGAIPVTVDSFIRAESDLYFSVVALKEGGFGKFEHHRELAPVDAQTVIRMNRDTLYSAAIFDLEAGPVTITLPDAGKRFMSLQTITEDQYSPPTIYDPGPHTLTREKVGTRYVMIGIRTLVDPSDPVSQKKVRDALIVLSTTLTDTSHAFGTKDEVDPIDRLISAAGLGAAIPERTPSILISRLPRTTARRSTSSMLRMCQ